VLSVYVLFPCFWLSVSVQSIALKDLSEMTYCVSSETLNPTHLLTHIAFLALGMSSVQNCYILPEKVHMLKLGMSEGVPNIRSLLQCLYR